MVLLARKDTPGEWRGVILIPVPATRRALATAVVLCGIFLVPPSSARADRLWALQLQGGSDLLSQDAPEERGRTIVFHRHPDGLFSSLPSGEVRRITIAEGPAHKPKKS